MRLTNRSIKSRCRLTFPHEASKDELSGIERANVAGWWMPAVSGCSIAEHGCLSCLTCRTGPAALPGSVPK